MIPHGMTYIWNLKEWYKWTYLQNRNRGIDIKKIIITKGEMEGEEGMN